MRIESIDCFAHDCSFVVGSGVYLVVPLFIELWGVLTGMENAERMDDRANVARDNSSPSLRMHLLRDKFKSTFGTLHSSIVHSKVGCAKEDNENVVARKQSQDTMQAGTSSVQTRGGTP